MEKRPELPMGKAEKLIPFFYYSDLQKGIEFCGEMSS